VKRVRIRRVFGESYHGDITVMVRNPSVNNLDSFVKHVEEEIRKKFKADVVLKVE